MRSIKDLTEKIKGLVRFRQPAMRPLSDDLFLGLLIIFVAFGSFGLGRLSKIEGSRTPVKFESVPEMTADTFSQNTPAKGASEAKNNQNTTQTANISGANEGQLVGSKNGTKYHYPWCAGAQKIAEANRVYFSSKAAAERAGYTPAGNCKGL